MTIEDKTTNNNCKGAGSCLPTVATFRHFMSKIVHLSTFSAEITLGCHIPSVSNAIFPFNDCISTTCERTLVELMLRGNDSHVPLYSLGPLKGTLKDFYLHLHKGKGDMMFCAVNEYLCSKCLLKVR